MRNIRGVHRPLHLAACPTLDLRTRNSPLRRRCRLHLAKLLRRFGPGVFLLRPLDLGLYRCFCRHLLRSPDLSLSEDAPALEFNMPGREREE